MELVSEKKARIVTIWGTIFPCYSTPGNNLAGINFLSSSSEKKESTGINSGLVFERHSLAVNSPIPLGLAGGLAKVIPPAQLQDKGNRYYYHETAKLPKGEVYVSLIDLNRELGKLDLPLKPMLRIATPIRDAAGIPRDDDEMRKFLTSRL